MAIDNTPPRLKLIVTIAIITVVTLVGINVALTSYFATMTDTAQREKLAPTKERDEQHAAEALALTKAAVPLDEAMALVAKGRPAAITPRPSDDLGPMTGWTRSPKVYTQAAAPAYHTPEPTAAADAGATTTALDPTAAADAGAHHNGSAAADAGAAIVPAAGGHAH